MWPTKCRTGHNDCHGILWVTSRITWLGIDRVANFCMIEKSLGFAVHGLRIAFRDLVRSEEVWPAESFVFPTWRFSYFVVYNLHNIKKPDNIGFSADGTLKLFDFGLAKEEKPGEADEEGAYKMTGQTGSRRYMAPEGTLRSRVDTTTKQSN